MNNQSVGNTNLLHKIKSLLTQSFAAAFVRTKLITLLAPALEATFTVGTTLAAVTFLCTFIHICNRARGQSYHVITKMPIFPWCAQISLPVCLQVCTLPFTCSSKIITVAVEGRGYPDNRKNTQQWWGGMKGCYPCCLPWHERPSSRSL